MKLTKKKEKDHSDFLKSKKFIHKDHDHPVYIIKDVIEGNVIISWDELIGNDVKYPVKDCMRNFKNRIWLFVK